MAVTDYTDHNQLNPYAPAIANNDAVQQRRQMMAQRLMQGMPAPQAPTGGSGGVMPLSGGGDTGAMAGGGGGLLGGLNAQQINEAAQALHRLGNPEGKVGLGAGMDGFRSGFLGTGLGGYNSRGADVLQGLGMYNPLPTT